MTKDPLRRVVAAALLAATAGAARADYQPRETFAPFDMGQAVNGYRGANGLPGPAFWQNRADYSILATLDPAAKTIAGTVDIRYRNASPDALDALWLQIDQNLYRPESRGALSRGGMPAGHTDGMTIEAASVEIGGRTQAVTPLVTDTRAKLPLAAPLAAGASAVIHLRYRYTVPHDSFGGRTGWLTSKTGDIFSIAQWYPRMAVYDDIRGWDTLPYLAQEFYLEYGNFDYAITVPAGMIVAGSGELTNPAEVLTQAQQERLAQARTSDATVMIRTPEEAAAASGNASGQRTWRFHMENSRDVAFSASTAFIWDAARIRLPGGRSSLAMSVYPAQSAGAAR